MSMGCYQATSLHAILLDLCRLIITASLGSGLHALLPVEPEDDRRILGVLLGLGQDVEQAPLLALAHSDVPDVKGDVNSTANL